jgi:hypothetical protein
MSKRSNVFRAMLGASLKIREAVEAAATGPYDITRALQRERFQRHSKTRLEFLPNDSLVLQIAECLC